MPTPLIGVDIGTTAVRAVELQRTRGGLQLHAVGQVGLPHGAVEDGEVADADAVAEALRRLWKEADFTGRNVVLGASGQRVIVRQAELPGLAPSEMRSAVRFEAEQLIPLPADETELGYSVLSGRPGGGPDATCRVLLAAAHRAALEGYLESAGRANLSVEAIDVSALAMLRALRGGSGPAAGGQQPVALVCVGAALTTVAVTDGDSPGFVRVLPGGGESLTSALAEREDGIDRNVAEAMKRASGPAASGALLTVAEPLITEIGQSLDFYLAQHPGATIRRVYLTGGGALATGFLEALAHRIDVPVDAADAFAGIDTSGWTQEQETLRRLNPVALSASGLALWSLQPPEKRLSLLPAAILRQRAQRRDVRRSALAVGGLTLVLVGGWGAQQVRVSNAEAAAQRAASAATAERARVQALAPVTHFFSAVDARVAGDRRALSGSVDWRSVIQRIASAMPKGTELTSFSVTPPAAAATPSTATSSSSAPTGPLVPAGETVSMQVTAHGNVGVVASWLQAMSRVPFLSDPWVAGSTVTAASASGPETVTFTCTATVDANAPVQHPNVGGNA